MHSITHFHHTNSLPFCQFLGKSTATTAASSPLPIANSDFCEIRVQRSEHPSIGERKVEFALILGLTPEQHFRSSAQSASSRHSVPPTLSLSHNFRPWTFGHSNPDFISSITDGYNKVWPISGILDSPMVGQWPILLRRNASAPFDFPAHHQHQHGQLAFDSSESTRQSNIWPTEMNNRSRIERGKRGGGWSG